MALSGSCGEQSVVLPNNQHSWHLLYLWPSLHPASVNESCEYGDIIRLLCSSNLRLPALIEEVRCCGSRCLLYPHLIGQRRQMLVVGLPTRTPTVTALCLATTTRGVGARQGPCRERGEGKGYPDNRRGHPAYHDLALCGVPSSPGTTGVSCSRRGSVRSGHWPKVRRPIDILAKYVFLPASHSSLPDGTGPGLGPSLDGWPGRLGWGAGGFSSLGVHTAVLEVSATLALGMDRRQGERGRAGYAWARAWRMSLEALTVPTVVVQVSRWLQSAMWAGSVDSALSTWPGQTASRPAGRSPLL